MTERDETKDDNRTGGVGDVEAAGETTAAAVVESKTVPDKPVGADTRVRVEGEPHPSGGE